MMPVRCVFNYDCNSSLCDSHREQKNESFHIEGKKHVATNGDIAFLLDKTLAGYQVYGLL